MDQRQYIYDCRTHRARLYLYEGALHDLDTGARLFVVEEDWAYGVATEAPTFWINGKFLYLYGGGSNLAVEPSLYLGRKIAIPEYREVSEFQETAIPMPQTEPQLTTARIRELGGQIQRAILPLQQRVNKWDAGIREELRSFVEWAGEKAVEFRNRQASRKVPKRLPGSRIIWDDTDIR